MHGRELFTQRLGGRIRIQPQAPVDGGFHCSIRFAGQSRDAASSRIDSLDNMRIAQDFLRQTLAQAERFVTPDLTRTEERIEAAADAVAAGRGRYGMILWVKDKDYARAARALGAR